MNVITLFFQGSVFVPWQLLLSLVAWMQWTPTKLPLSSSPAWTLMEVLGPGQARSPTQASSTLVSAGFLLWNGNLWCKSFEMKHLSSLAITGHLHLVERDHLAWWLAERQLPSGGLNGRPEKLPDVCYSWWECAWSSAQLEEFFYNNHQVGACQLVSAGKTELGGQRKAH